MKVLVTGASGFVGGALVERLVKAGHLVTAMSRGEVAWPHAEVTPLRHDIARDGDIAGVLAGHHVVIHLAARAHITREGEDKPLEAFRRVNRDATLALASAALRAGVQRFVFVSSIGVNGSRSGRQPFTEDSPVNPSQPYAISKLEAEQGLCGMVGAGGMKLTIVRPPLVYGVGAPGNMLRLLRLVAGSTPLPLANASAPKSFVGVGNLADFLVLAMASPATAGKLFLVADSEPASTVDLVRSMAVGMGKSALLFTVPGVLTQMAGRIPRLGKIFDQLFTPLVVDSSAAQAAVDWRPTPTLDGILEMARAYAEAPWPPSQSR